MAKQTKKQKALATKLGDNQKLYGVDEAIQLLKDLKTTKFDESLEVSLNLGVDPRHADQVVRGTVVLPAGTGKSSFIDVRDIAESAAVALTTDRFDGQSFNLTGPETVSYADAAQLLSEVAGKPVRYVPIDDSAFVEALTGAGVARDYADFLASIFHPVREGWTAAVTDHVQTLTGISGDRAMIALARSMRTCTTGLL